MYNSLYYKVMALIVYNKKNSCLQEVTYKGKRTINLDSRGIVYLSKTMSIELGCSWRRPGKFCAWWRDRGLVYLPYHRWGRVHRVEGQRCARFFSGFIVHRLTQQVKIERKSVQFMMAKTPMEVGGAVYTKYYFPIRFSDNTQPKDLSTQGGVRRRPNIPFFMGEESKSYRTDL